MGPAGNEVKARLLAGRPCYLMAIRLARTTEIVGIAAAAGYHGFFVDLQHATISEDDAAAICLAGMQAGLTPLVRLPGDNHAVAEHMLEAGAQGLILPDARSAEQVASVAAACRFPPRGTRSPLGPGPHTGFRAPDQNADRARVEADTLFIAMLEHEDGIAAASEIAALAGVDALMIGTNDLTSSIGLHGQYEHPRVKALYAAAIAGAGRQGKPVIAGGIRDPEIVARYVAVGVARCYVTGTDTALLAAGAAAQLKRFEAIGPAAPQ